MEIAEIELERLIPYARNPRRNADAVATVAASIAEFGFRQPIVVDENMVIVAGHTRYEAAKYLGLKVAPVHIARELTPSQVKAYRLMDNRAHQNATWMDDLLGLELEELRLDDFDLDLTGFDDAELDRLLALAEEGLAAEDGTAPIIIPEPPRNPVSRRGDLWLIGEHRLLCGDACQTDDVRRLMGGERATLFATDPPYLIGYCGTNHPTRNKDWSPSYGVDWDDAAQGPELYEGFIAAALAEAITEDAAWYCWHASRRQAMVEAVWEKMGAFVHQQIVWVKDRGVLTRSHYLWKHEPCLFGWLKGKRPPKVADETLPSTWELPGFAGAERPDHPTPKPLECFAIPMRQHVKRGGLCYEPFSGSGSQIMAGEAIGRRVCAMEIAPAYVDVAVLRWQEATGRTAVLDGEGATFAQVAQARGIEAPPPDAGGGAGGRAFHPSMR